MRALQGDAVEKTYVYRVTNGHVVKTPIKISGLNDEYMRILSGVSEDDMVVVSGFKRLSDNIKVVY